MADEEMAETLPLSFPSLLFLRIASEFTKLYKRDRTDPYLDLLDTLTLDFDAYRAIFTHLTHLTSPHPSQHHDYRLILGEWVKYSLQLPIEEENTR